MKTQTELDSAIERLREIAALKGTSKRQRVNSELALNWLISHGYAREPGGYVDGIGFEDSVAAAERRMQHTLATTCPGCGTPTCICGNRLLRRQAE
jgi:hypothetical protein